MKKLNILTILALFVLTLFSCYEQETFTDKNIKESQGYYPVIQSFSVLNTPTGGAFNVADKVELQVKYWSTDPIKEFQLHYTVNTTEKLYSTTPYSYGFVAEEYAEVLKLEFVVPTEISGTESTLKVIVVNDNGLQRERTVKINVN